MTTELKDALSALGGLKENVKSQNVYLESEVLEMVAPEILAMWRERKIQQGVRLILGHGTHILLRYTEGGETYPGYVRKAHVGANGAVSYDLEVGNDDATWRPDSTSPAGTRREYNVDARYVFPNTAEYRVALEGIRKAEWFFGVKTMDENGGRFRPSCPQIEL